MAILNLTAKQKMFRLKFTQYFMVHLLVKRRKYIFVDPEKTSLFNTTIAVRFPIKPSIITT